MSRKKKRRKTWWINNGTPKSPEKVVIPAMVVGNLSIETETASEILPPRFVSRVTHATMPTAAQIERNQTSIIFPEEFYWTRLRGQIETEVQSNPEVEFDSHELLVKEEHDKNEVQNIQNQEPSKSQNDNNSPKEVEV